MSKIKSQKLRDSAHDEPCTLNIAGVCNYDETTTVLAHLPDESNGMGTKSTDLSSCYACSSCHDVIDRRTFSELSAYDMEFYMRRAQVRTLNRFVELGLIVIK